VYKWADGSVYTIQNMDSVAKQYHGVSIEMLRCGGVSGVSVSAFIGVDSNFAAGCSHRSTRVSFRLTYLKWSSLRRGSSPLN